MGARYEMDFSFLLSMDFYVIIKHINMLELGSELLSDNGEHSQLIPCCSKVQTISLEAFVLYQVFPVLIEEKGLHSQTYHVCRERKSPCMHACEEAKRRDRARAPFTCRRQPLFSEPLPRFLGTQETLRSWLDGQTITCGASVREHTLGGLAY